LIVNPQAMEIVPRAAEPADPQVPAFPAAKAAMFSALPAGAADSVLNARGAAKSRLVARADRLSRRV
jgi:hypothetical protein